MGRFTRLGASIMIMGSYGNAIVPLFYGWLISLIHDRHIEFYFPAIYNLYSMQYTVTASEPGDCKNQKKQMKPG
jgi:fucose permease